MLSDKQIEDLKAKGLKPKTKDRITLDPMNYEVRQIANNLIPNYRADGSGLIKVDFFSFDFITRLYQHKDAEFNLLKLKALYAEINAPALAAKRKATDKKEPVQ